MQIEWIFELNRWRSSEELHGSASIAPRLFVTWSQLTSAVVPVVLNGLTRTSCTNTDTCVTAGWGGFVSSAGSSIWKKKVGFHIHEATIRASFPLWRTQSSSRFTLGAVPLDVVSKGEQDKPRAGGHFPPFPKQKQMISFYSVIFVWMREESVCKHAAGRVTTEGGGGGLGAAVVFPLILSSFHQAFVAWRWTLACEWKLRCLPLWLNLFQIKRSGKPEEKQNQGWSCKKTTTTITIIVGGGSQLRPPVGRFVPPVVPSAENLAVFSSEFVGQSWKTWFHVRSVFLFVDRVHGWKLTVS